MNIYIWIGVFGLVSGFFAMIFSAVTDRIDAEMERFYLPLGLWASMFSFIVLATGLCI